MCSSWKDHPNTKHIDRVLEHFENNRQIWTDSYNRDYADEMHGSFSPVVNIISDDERFFNIWRDVCSIVKLNDYCEDGWMMVTDILGALLVYEDCSYLLESTPEEVHIMGILGKNDALLMYRGMQIMRDNP